VQEPLDQNDTTTSQLEDMMNTFDEPQQQIWESFVVLLFSERN
jgi:hypothetical protein